MNHHVIFLDYDFKSSLLHSCSSLIGCLWVIHMAVDLCANLVKSFRLHMWKQMELFLESHRSNICMQFRYRDDITPHNSITSPPSIGMSHPIVSCKSLGRKKCRLRWCIFTSHWFVHVSSYLFWSAALHLKLIVWLASPLSHFKKSKFLYLFSLFVFSLFII